MRKWSFFVVILAFQSVQLMSQIVDSAVIHTLDPIQIKAYRVPLQEVRPMESVNGMYITAGKKNEVIQIQDLPAHITEKTGRQIFAKIPGAFIYDMDGSGNQINIATRGLDPHRSWEYNVRQNGVMTNSDIYGYPASHYSPPMEAIQRIEVIRGTASLQYGSQFGGMINYVLKSPDTTRQWSWENISSVGSFGLLSTFQSVGGRLGKWTYAGYYQQRVSNGYRENARSTSQAQYGSLQYRFSPDLQLQTALGRSQYLYQIPGPLTDSMFYADPRQSTRSRNYFSPDIYLPSVQLDWKIAPGCQISWISSAVLGDRSSVQFIGFADARDTINALTLAYQPRQVDIDQFHSYASELRVQGDYRIRSSRHTLTGGIRYTNNDLHRMQLGKGSSGTDFDLRLTEPFFGRDIHFKSRNTAFFIENLFRITTRFQLSLGCRMENGVSRMSGIVSYLPDEEIPQDIVHRFPLLGGSAQYAVRKEITVYGGWSQSYRPVIFSDIIPANALEKTDPDLRDAFGHNAEAGIRGQWKNRIQFDANVFYILYQNRIGSQVLADATGNSFVWKTNIGDSRTLGVEMYLEGKLWENESGRISVFTASSWFDGIYLNGMLRQGNTNTDLTGNRLETVPEWISRNGLQLHYKRLAAVLQYSYVDASFSDALNTVEPSSNGAKGIVPSYGIWDINLSYRIGQQIVLKAGIQNFTNRQYFTKRPTGYPGQGVWSSDGRGIVLTLGTRF